ncbi:hypothetical protein NHH03_10410 [Stieleria sp. TO1_6]|nr:hypothetical protein [Stieleria tagensis]
MDANQNQLDKKLADLLKQAAEVAAQMQAQQQGPGTPHFDQIEIPAHEVGQRLSQMIQSTRATDVALEQGQRIKCPDCSKECRVEPTRRQVHSMDGPIELTESVAHCRRCRRSFFPSA